jgi:ATP-dependent DNA helicase PIF1
VRVDQNDPQSAQFAAWLLDVGHGRNLPLDHSITLPEGMQCGPVVPALISEVYPDIQTGPALTDKYFLECSILCAHNVDVDDINAKVNQEYPGAVRVYYSVDSVERSANDGLEQYTVEYLNSINIPSLPPSQLVLKRGAPLMLLQNIDATHGLCNGTRVRLINMTHRILEVRIITGPQAGETAFIPRITLTPSEEQLPFELSCLRFPVCPAFAITINKSQRQSLGTGGLDLCYPVFARGQFYVGVSRGTNMGRVKVLLPEDSEGAVTKNVVYHTVLFD